VLPSAHLDASLCGVFVLLVVAMLFALKSPAGAAAQPTAIEIPPQVPAHGVAA
jgi:hypothetical protein